jgi:hypothetical protein
MIKKQGRGKMARLYEIEGGSHCEGIYGQHPNLLRPMLPCFRQAFEVLEQWTPLVALEGPLAITVEQVVPQGVVLCPPQGLLLCVGTALCYVLKGSDLSG